MKKTLLILCSLLMIVLFGACGQTVEDAGAIITEYYTVTPPDTWEGRYVYEITGREDQTYTLTLSEKTAYEEMGAGTLCTLMLFSTADSSYKELPDYRLLAALDTPEGAFYVAAVFPTDVQFSETSAEAYLALSEQIPEVLATLKAAEGIDITLP